MQNTLTRYRMSQEKFITNADTALANQMWNVIEGDSEAKEVISSKEQIFFAPPKAVSAKAASKISIFLYNIEVKAIAEKELATFLHYLVTPFTGDERKDHVLLEKIVQALQATPQMVADGQVSVGLYMRVDSLSIPELSSLWTALGIPLRPSVSITVAPTALPFGSSVGAAAASSFPQRITVTQPAANKVSPLYQAVLKTFTEQYDGWKSRNLFLRRWIFQRFNKITGVTADEMLASLKSLGDKLELHAPTDQFVKQLNQLAGYYQEQRGELEGMNKVSHNQDENLKAIEVWIKEVKELIEALTPT